MGTNNTIPFIYASKCAHDAKMSADLANDNDEYVWLAELLLEFCFRFFLLSLYFTIAYIFNKKHISF